MSILNNVELVFPSISLWSGKASAKQEECNVSLPEIVSLGCKQIFDVAKLRPLQKYKKQVERLGLKYGIRFEGGYMVPIEHTDSFLKEFAAIKEKFDEEKQHFLDEYTQNCQSFIDDHVELESMIRSSLPDLAYLTRRIGCSVRTYRAQQSNGTEVSAIEVKQSVFDEIAMSCSTILKDCFLNPEIVLKGVSVNTRMKPVLAKLTSFSFVDSRINTVIDSINSYLLHITSEVLDKHELDVGITLFSLLSNSTTLESIVDSDWKPSIVNPSLPIGPEESMQALSEDAYF